MQSPEVQAEIPHQRRNSDFRILNSAFRILNYLSKIIAPPWPPPTHMVTMP